jgi:hypothetical protein
MINTAQIPPEVVEAAGMQLPGMAGHQRYVRAAIAAALNAWPGMTLHQQDINAEYSYFVLPLPQEARDE